MIANLAGVLFDGIAYGALLFLVSVGLSVTLGLMNFVNLAHGAFAMLGGYVCVVSMTQLGVPFLAALPVAFVVTAVAGVVLERTLYRRLYGASHLDQVLFSDRPRVHGDRRRDVASSGRTSSRCSSPIPAGPGQPRGRRPRRLPAVPDRRRRRHHGRAAMADRIDALRRAVARVGRQRARPPDSASTSTACSR
jgi:hypothetical protein